MLRRSILFGAAATAVLGVARAQAPAQRSYVMATATTGGTYYPVGVALATLAKIRLQAQHGIDMAAISSAGSGENIRLMRENQSQFSILQGLFGEWARTGSGTLQADGPQPQLRSVMQLWPNVEHFLQRADLAPTGTVADLERIIGQGFAIGARNSGTEHSNRFLMTNLGFDPARFNLAFLGFNPAADALINGNVVGTNLGAGPPVAAVTRAIAQMGDRVKLLELTDEQLKKADGGTGLYFRYVVKAGTYPGQAKDFLTTAQPNFLAANAAVPEEDVYLFTKAVYENLPFLNNIHAATREMTLDNAMAGLPLPLHPGAARFYREKNMAIADRLQPPR
jgi:uncharacterized protein